MRPGYNYVPTPSNYGGAPRERDVGSPAAAPQSAAAPAPVVEQTSGGFFGWLKSLFGGKPAAPAATEVRPYEQRNGDRSRSGRGRGQGGQGGGGDGQRRRNRGGRGRSQSRGEYRSGGEQSGGPAN